MAGINEWSSDIELRLFENIADQTPGLYADTFIQNLYDAALFNYDIDTAERKIILEAMRDRMWDEYGVDFDNVFDWEAFREAYDRA